MKPWVKSWEHWASEQPHAIALVNASGQSWSFSELRRRAWSIEHRFRMLGLDAGDRVELTLDRGQPIDEWVVAVWAAGFRRAVCVPSWSGFTKRESSAWDLRKTYPPRLMLDTTQGTEEVSSMPGPASHDLGFAWPSRALEGGERTQAPMVLHPLSDDALVRAMENWQGHVGLSPGDRVAVMDGGLSVLGWLSVFTTLALGGTVVQCSRPYRMTSKLVGDLIRDHGVSWLCASAEWLSHAGKPPQDLPIGVIAPWGHAAPALRNDWCARVRWIEAWCPASCGWWWGAVEYHPDRPLCLEQCVVGIDWTLDDRDEYLRVWQPEGKWAPVARVARSTAGELGLSFCGVADRQVHRQVDRLIGQLRLNPRFGEVVSGQDWGRPFIAIVPRSLDEEPYHVLQEAKSLVESIEHGASSLYRWVVAASILPRDECGNFYARRLPDLSQR